VRAARAACIALSAALLLAACQKPPAKAERKPRTVAVLPAERRDLVIESEYAARIFPDRQVNLTPKVGGRVLEVSVEVGDPVAAGQALLTIDASDYDAQYRQAMGALQSAEANMTRSNDAGQESQLIQAQAAYDQARMGYDETKKAWDKTKRLFDGGVVSRQQFDEVDVKLKGAAIQLDAATKGLDLVRDKAGPQASEVLSGQVDQARAATDLAKGQVESAILRSPIDGRVSYRNVEAGELVGPSSLAFVLIDDRSVLAEAELSEKVVGSVREGMRIDIVVPALGPEPRRGTVAFVGPAMDPRTLLYAVRIRLPNPDGSMRAGMLARLKLIIERRRDAILVPERATFTEGGADYVMVVHGGVAKKRRLALGQTDGSSVEALQGLEAGEFVVVQGQEFVGDGDPVIAIEAP
jgi:HlyD family secretion protein